jgi:hypothetical protein
MRFHNGSVSECVSNFLLLSWKKCNGDAGNDQTSIQGRKHELYTERPDSTETKKARQVKSMFIKRIVCKEIVLAGQRATSAYYCDVLW